MLGFAGSPWTSRPTWSPAKGSKDQAETARCWPIAIPGFQAIIDAIVDGDGGLSVRPDRSRRRGGAAVRQLGRQPCARAVRTLGDRAQCRDHRPSSRRAPRAGDRLPQGCRRKAAGLCCAKPASMPWGSTRRSIRPGPCRACRRHAGAGQSRSAAAARRGRRWKSAVRASWPLCRSAACVQPGPRHRQDTPIAHVEHLLRVVRRWRK
jgi:hypothetical protein